MRGLSGRTILITGAAGGLGRAIACGFAAAGCAMTLSDLDAGVLDDVAATLHDADVPIRCVAADLSTSEGAPMLAGAYARADSAGPSDM